MEENKKQVKRGKCMGKSELRKGIINQELNYSVWGNKKLTPCKLHLIKTGIIKKQPLHWWVLSIVLSLCDSLASVKAWDYSELALPWVCIRLGGIYTMSVASRERKTIGFSNKIFISIYCNAFVFFNLQILFVLPAGSYRIMQ